MLIVYRFHTLDYNENYHRLQQGSLNKMFEVGTRVIIKEGAIGYCHPDMQDKYTGRNAFAGEPLATIARIPEKDDNSYCFMVQVSILPDDYYAFKSSDLKIFKG